MDSIVDGGLDNVEDVLWGADTEVARMMLGQLVEYSSHELSRDGPARTLFLEQIAQPHVLEGVECTDISMTMVITNGLDISMTSWMR